MGATSNKLPCKPPNIKPAHHQDAAETKPSLFKSTKAKKGISKYMYRYMVSSPKVLIIMHSGAFQRLNLQPHLPWKGICSPQVLVRFMPFARIFLHCRWKKLEPQSCECGTKPMNSPHQNPSTNFKTKIRKTNETHS